MCGLGLLVAASAAAFGGGACGSDDGGGGPVAVQPDGGTALCIDGKPAAAYPPGPYELGTLGTVPPEMAFDVGDGTTIKVSDYFEPCASRSRILVVRSSPLWCGTCLWHLSHTARFMDDARFAGRLVLVDLLIADEDNMPATAAALPRFRSKIDAPASDVSRMALDPKYSFGPALQAKSPLPEYVFIDTRTMKILSTMSDPNPEALVIRLAIELADLDKVARPDQKSPTLIDDNFTENQMDVIRGMRLVDAPPPDPTNEYGDVPAAAALGKKLYSDALLSPANVSCAKCHDPALALGDAIPQSVGITKVDRNAPNITLAAHARWQFWDGRADTLWMQALGPPENPAEMGSSRLYIAHQISQRYAAEYAAVFGAKYALPDMTPLPAAGKPGDAAYDALSADVKDAITRVYVNVGKAIAAFERTFRAQPNNLDKYLDGDLNALSTSEKHALVTFMKNGCAQCHWGPRLTDDAFHTVRFGTGAASGVGDEGRIAGLPKLAAGEFIASSKWSDSPSSLKPFVVDAPTMLGAFKTPTLRGITASAPYGHGGTIATLREVAHHYGIRGLDPADTAAVGTTEEWVPNFDLHIEGEMLPFLDALTGVVTIP